MPAAITFERAVPKAAAISRDGPERVVVAVIGCAPVGGSCADLEGAATAGGLVIGRLLSDAIWF